MQNSEAFKKFQEPHRTFPKKNKQKYQIVNCKEGKHYNDKQMSEHSKAISTFGGMLSYYKERENTVNYDDPILRK